MFEGMHWSILLVFLSSRGGVVEKRYGKGCSRFCSRFPTRPPSRTPNRGTHVRSPPFCRVAPGDRSPGAPTDPDVRNSRIRLLRQWLRYAICTLSERREAPEAGTLSGSPACGPKAFLDSSVAPTSSAIGVAPAVQSD